VYYEDVQREEEGPGGGGYRYVVMRTMWDEKIVK
jgi:hypothetical protein